MNRDQHMQKAGIATIDTMANESAMESLRKNFESLLLKPGTPANIIDGQREAMHTQLDVLLDALTRQKHHLRAAMLASGDY